MTTDVGVGDTDIRFDLWIDKEDRAMALIIVLTLAGEQIYGLNDASFLFLCELPSCLIIFFTRTLWGVLFCYTRSMSIAPQSDKTFEEISQTIHRHLVERDWQDNPPRGLAISIALEANELLEHYQWSDTPVGTTADVAEELADILIYAFQFAHVNGIDIPDAIEKKLQKAALKYPAEKFKGRSDEERSKAWLDSKINHRKKGL